MKFHGECLEILSSEGVLGESLSGEMAFELISKGQEEPAMERAWRRACRAEGTASAEAGAVGKMGGTEC